jgi:ankyrin repeat protein
VSGFDVTTPLKEFHNETCLHLISNFGTLTMAYMCLSRVPSTNYLNFKDNEMRTAMMCAVVGGKNDILQLLIYAGADATIKVSAYLMG